MAGTGEVLSIYDAAPIGRGGLNYMVRKGQLYSTSGQDAMEGGKVLTFRTLAEAYRWCVENGGGLPVFRYRHPFHPGGSAGERWLRMAPDAVDTRRSQALAQAVGVPLERPIKVRRPEAAR